MGVLNVTPDSFSDGGHHFEFERAVERGLHMVREGADIIDIGGESTRPYSRRISNNEELDRVIPVIEALTETTSIPISIDTYKSEVAGEALKSGASIINDISALRFDSRMPDLVARSGVPVICMHMKGTPENMQENPTYSELIPEIVTFLKDAVNRALSAGVREDLIIVDPGIGFGKTFHHNLEILKDLHLFQSLQKPLLVGSSRKAFIGHILDKGVTERDVGTMATVSACVMNGAHIVRVHDVGKAVDTVRIIDAIKRGQVGDG
jgi:dihydropteroate synthase